MTEVKRVIEQMALVKMNVLHWHLTDDQAWRIESKRFPALHQQHGAEYFSHEDIREVVAFAQSRGIDVEPEIEMPGHVSALLAAYPQYSCSGRQVRPATCGGIYPVILCAGSEDTYGLISDLMDEICPLFPSQKFHIGGDEAPKKEWKNCPRCQQKIKNEGLADETALQGYFSNRVIDILREKGKTAVCWNESLDAGNFDRRSLIQFWTVNGADALARFAQSGGRFIYSDMFTWYLDYPHSMTPLRRLYESALEIDGVDYAESPALLGVEACLWAEHIRDAEGLEKQLFPRLYAAAEVMWCGAQRPGYEDFERRLRAFLATHHPADMALTPEDGWNPEGEARRNDAFAYMAALNDAMSPEVRAETVESSAPTPLFQQKFMQCFFQPSDLPFLMQSMQGET